MRPFTRTFICAACVLSIAFAVRATPSGEEAVWLERLAGGTLDERTAAARWLGLHLVEEAREPLHAQLEAAPRDAAHAEFVRTAELMLALLWRPRTLELHSLDAVLNGLNAEETHVRAKAVRHLAYYAPPDAVALAAPFLDSAEPLVREEAITTLRHLGDTQHAERVLESLDDDGAAVRLRALEYLLALDRAELLPRLVVVAADANPWIAQPAVRALEQDGGGPAAAAAIFANIGTEASPALLARYLTALERFESRDGWPRRWAAQVLPLLTHDDGAVRHAAALLLGDGDPDIARDVLLGLVASEDDVQRLSAARALADGEWPVDTDTVERLLDDPIEATRLAAIDLSAQLPPQTRRELLLAVLARPAETSDVRSRALAGLAEVGTGDDVARLVHYAGRSPSEHELINVALTMAALERRWDTDAARNWFRAQLGDPATGRATRQAIVRALQVVGDPSFLPPLAAELRGLSDDERDRVYAAALVQTMSVLVGRKVHGRDFADSGLQ